MSDTPARLQGLYDGAHGHPTTTHLLKAVVRMETGETGHTVALASEPLSSVIIKVLAIRGYR